MEVWVLCWKYDDLSGFGIAGVYANKEIAEHVLDVAGQDNSRTFYLEVHDVIGGN